MRFTNYCIFCKLIIQSCSFCNNQNNGANTVNSTVDGFTTVITAEANVLCGATYRIRLAIADGTDTGLSSLFY